MKKLFKASLKRQDTLEAYACACTSCGSCNSCLCACSGALQRSKGSSLAMRMSEKPTDPQHSFLGPDKTCGAGLFLTNRHSK